MSRYIGRFKRPDQGRLQGLESYHRSFKAHRYSSAVILWYDAVVVGVVCRHSVSKQSSWNCAKRYHSINEMIFSWWPDNLYTITEWISLKMYYKVFCQKRNAGMNLVVVTRTEYEWEVRMGSELDIIQMSE